MESDKGNTYKEEDKEEMLKIRSPCEKVGREKAILERRKKEGLRRRTRKWLGKEKAVGKEEEKKE